MPTTTFGKTAIDALFSQVTSRAQSLGIFAAGVNQHPPENTPGLGAAYSVWLSEIRPLPNLSGLGATSARVEFTGHIFTRSRSRPADEVDPEAMLLATDLLGAYSSGFTLGGEVMQIDLLGAYGTPLLARAAWADFQGTPMRLMEVVLPVVLDDLWAQGA